MHESLNSVESAFKEFILILEFLFNYDKYKVLEMQEKAEVNIP